MKIKKQSNDVFRITVSESTITQHEITVTDSIHHDLTERQATEEDLLDFSFKFLLGQ